MNSPLFFTPEAAAPTADDLLDTLPYGLVVLSQAGRVLRLNQQAAAWWGLPQAAVQGQLLATLSPAHLPPALLVALQQLAAGAELPPATYFVPARQQWLAQTTARQAGHLTVHWQDVTAQHLREPQHPAPTAAPTQQAAARSHALPASNDLWQGIYDTSPIGMAVLRAVRDDADTIQDFRIDSANQAMARAMNRPDLMGKLFLAEYPTIRSLGLFDLMLQVMATGEPNSMEYCYEHADSPQWFSSIFVKLGDGLVNFKIDITARKQAKQALRKSLGLLEQSEQIAELGNWDYEVSTGIFTWSVGMYRLFGLPPGSPVSARTYLDCVEDEDRPTAECLLRHLREGTSGFEKVLRIRVAGQVKTLRTKAVMLHNEQGQPVRVLGVDLDISEVQRLQQENLHMRLSQQQARIGAVLEAQEEERRRLAESLHNGLGQLLYATKLQLDQLTKAPQLAATPALAAARHEADRLLSEVIRQARTISHELTPGIVADFGLAAALQDICCTLSSPQLRWQCLVNLEDEPELPLPLQVALYRLAQEVTQNIVKHAHASFATLEVETLPGWLVLRAEDNGRGFEPTAATSGIGLKTLRHRVALLGGTLHLRAVPGQGTQLQLRIPLANSPSV